MIKLQQNRYLWVHLAGLAFVPLLLDICLAGLASAGPALPFQGHFWAIALLTISPALAMQWLKPFYVFSLPPVALKPAVLSTDQRRCLQIFKSWQIKALAIAVAIFSVWLLAQLYALTPVISPRLRPTAGLVSAAITFFLATTFMQIAVSSARALLISPEALQRVAAVEERAITSDFLIPGIRVSKLFLETPAQAASEPTPSEPDPSKPDPSPPIQSTQPTDDSTDTPDNTPAADSFEPASKPAPAPAEPKAEVFNDDVSSEAGQSPPDQQIEASTSTEADSQEAGIQENDREKNNWESNDKANDNELEVVIPEPIPPEEADNLPM